MQYLLLIHSDEKAMQTATQEETGSILAAYGAYMKAMADAGVSKGGMRLRPTSTATTVRTQNGKTQVLNGPYAEVKEQLGGYFLIDAPDRRRRDILGGALPRRPIRRDRSSAGLGDVTGLDTDKNGPADFFNAAVEAVAGPGVFALSAAIEPRIQRGAAPCNIC